MIEAATDTQPAWAQGEGDEHDVQSAPGFRSGKLGGPEAAAVTASRSDDTRSAPDKKAAAQAYARRGYSIMPLCWTDTAGNCAYRGGRHGAECQSPGKKPILSSWKAFQTCPATEAEADCWWTANPQANIGLITGKLSGVVVLDADSAEAIALVEGMGGLDGAPTQRTGKGRHWLFKHPGVKVTNFAGNFWKGVDFRGDGGYIVAPPSIHKNGRQYEWEIAPDAADPPPVPDWLMQALVRKQQPNVERQSANHDERVVDSRELRPVVRIGTVVGDDEVFGTVCNDEGGLDLEAYVLGIQEGERDTRLFALAGRLRNDNVPKEAARLTLRMAARLCVPPFDQHTAENMVDRAWESYKPTIGLVQDGEGPMPFPVDALPEAVARYVREAAAATVAPPEYIAVPFLVAAGAVIGNRLELALKRSWRQGANLYAACVGTPGSKKSPAINVALKPLRRLQAELAQAHVADLEKWKVEHQAWKEEKDLKKPEPTQPTFPHLLATDATVEALVPMLAGSPGILLHMDELVAWVRAMNQYKQGGKGADRQHYLSFWGREMVKVDRRGRINEPVMVEHPSLSVVGGIQPDLLSSLTDAAGDDGFLDRLLWADPDPLPCRWTDDDVSNRTTKGVVDLFKMLNGLPYAIGAYDDQVAVAVIFDPQAKDRWVRWYEQHGAEADAVPSQLQGVWNKLPNQLARITLILHALDTVRPAGTLASGLGAVDGSPRSKVASQISLDTLEAAITILDYFKAHARRVYDRMYGKRGRGGDRRAATTGGADTVRVRVLKALETAERLSENDLLRGVLGGHVKSDELRAVLEDLEAEDTIVREVVPGRGRPTTYWRLADGHQVVQDAAA